MARSKRVKLHNVQNISPQDSSTVVLVNEATASNTLTGTLSNKKNKALSGVEVSPLYIRTMPLPTLCECEVFSVYFSCLWF